MVTLNLPRKRLILSENPILHDKMSKFSAPADKVVHETRGYIDSQIENVKLHTVKGLSKGTSALAGLLLIFIMVGALVTALSFAVVLWLGEVLNSYALAAFIMSGVLLVVLVLLFLLRKHLFKNSFVSMYTDVFFQKESVGLKTQEGLDWAIRETESRIKKDETGISVAVTQFREYYSFKHILTDGLIPLVSRLFRKDKTEKEE